MSGELAIREARAEDAAAIVAMLRDFAEFEKLTHIFGLTPEIVVKDFIGPDRRVQCEIAEWDGAPAGVMIWFCIYGTFEARPAVYLEDLYVQPEFRGRGIGTAFLKRLAQHALEDGANRIDWIVLDWNERAIEFYKGVGAPIAGDWRVCRISGSALQKLAER